MRRFLPLILLISYAMTLGQVALVRMGHSLWHWGGDVAHEIQHAPVAHTHGPGADHHHTTYVELILAVDWPSADDLPLPAPVKSIDVHVGSSVHALLAPMLMIRSTKGVFSDRLLRLDRDQRWSPPPEIATST